MIIEPKCRKRGCVYYGGIEQPDGTELSEQPVCLAFPKGIPEEIAFGDNKHSEPLPNQGNDIVFQAERRGAGR